MGSNVLYYTVCPFFRTGGYRKSLTGRGNRAARPKGSEIFFCRRRKCLGGLTAPQEGVQVVGPQPCVCDRLRMPCAARDHQVNLGRKGSDRDTVECFTPEHAGEKTPKVPVRSVDGNNTADVAFFEPRCDSAGDNTAHAISDQDDIPAGIKLRDEVFLKLPHLLPLPGVIPQILHGKGCVRKLFQKRILQPPFETCVLSRKVPNTRDCDDAHGAPPFVGPTSAGVYENSGMYCTSTLEFCQ